MSISVEQQDSFHDPRRRATSSQDQPWIGRARTVPRHIKTDVADDAVIGVDPRKSS
jgi:hypothetical protein